MTDDEQLLRQYTQERAESAFAELVTRHIDLVYAAALRFVNGDTHLAQDVTQTVFIDLASKAWRLPRGVILAGWLHRHTCFTAATAVRTERRRRTREQTAMEMRALDENTEPHWKKMAPFLDECLNQLNPSDRDALVLRFLRQQDFRAVGAALGISADAAQKRVSRALEKLRVVLSRRGVVLTAAALTAALTTETVTAAPASLAAGVTAASLAAATETGTKSFILKLMAGTKLQTGIISALVVASVLAPLAILQQAHAKLRGQNDALRQQTDRLAILRGENARLSNLLTQTEGSRTVPNEPFNELMRLRGESGRLQGIVQALVRSKTNKTLSREETLDSLRQMYSDRVKRLKQLFADNPSQAVPELQYLTDSLWLELVRYDHHAIDPDNSHAMSSARSSAQIHFADSVLSDALRQYGKNNNGQFPTDVSQLAPYFRSPVADSILQDWAILPGSSLPGAMRSDEDWVITQKAPVNAELDQRIVIGLKSGHLGTGGSSQWGLAP
jgi:RNA polymerase sigma factor (sigma-70 family)